MGPPYAIGHQGLAIARELQTPPVALAWQSNGERSLEGAGGSVVQPYVAVLRSDGAGAAIRGQRRDDVSTIPMQRQTLHFFPAIHSPDLHTSTGWVIPLRSCRGQQTT